MRDRFGRLISYLRLSITDRCDFRCRYCLPRSHRDFLMPREWLDPDELARITRVFAGLGVSHVRLTGGEPLLRTDIADIAQRLSTLPGIDELSLSTNASQLAKSAQRLKAAGISRLNISLDSLDAARFRDITGGDLARVLRGIDAALAAGFAPIKVNMVVMRGVNDDEIDAMVDFCLDKGLALRFIETMPVGHGGQQAQRHYLPLGEVEARLKRRFRLSPAAMHGSGPARYLQVDDSALRIGFITPQSQHFCDTCNRVRMSASGTLYLCLGQDDNVELGQLLRAGADDAQLRTAIVDAIARKPQRHDFLGAPSAVLRPMSALGG